MDNLTQNKIGTLITLRSDLDTAKARTVEALKAEGFGVLTEIDVRETLQKKLGVDFSPYLILGACNPLLAQRALTLAPEVGLLLPCNVTIRRLEDGDSQVGLVDPTAMLGVVSNPALKEVAEEAQARLGRVAAALQEAA